MIVGLPSNRMARLRVVSPSSPMRPMPMPLPRSSIDGGSGAVVLVAEVDVVAVEVGAVDVGADEEGGTGSVVVVVDGSTAVSCVTRSGAAVPLKPRSDRPDALGL